MPFVLDPEYVDAYNLRGMIKVELGHAEAAISDYDTAIRLDTENIRAWGKPIIRKT